MPRGLFDARFEYRSAKLVSFQCSDLADEKFHFNDFYAIEYFHRINFIFIFFFNRSLIK